MRCSYKSKEGFAMTTYGGYWVRWVHVRADGVPLAWGPWVRPVTDDEYGDFLKQVSDLGNTPDYVIDRR